MDRPADAADATTRFDDWHAIQTLVARYLEFADGARFAEAAAMFEGATYRVETGGAGPSKIVTHSASELLGHMVRTPLFADGTPRTRHTITNLIVELDGDAATSRCYLTIYQQTPTLPLQPIATGRYFDRFERVDGKWRFADRLVTGFLVGDTRGHKKV
jgi:hypothetical protein